MERSKLEQADGVSRWKQVVDQLNHDIATGHLSPGQKMPAELDLATRYGVARQTIRRAIQHLREAGRVRSEHGRGTFVTEKLVQSPLTSSQFFEQNLFKNKRRPARKLISDEFLQANEILSDALQVDYASDVLLMVTLGSADSVPITIASNYYPVSRMPGIRAALDNSNLSLRAALTELGIGQLFRQYMRIRARPASDFEARLLDIDRSECLMETLVCMSDKDDIPMIYSTTVYASSRVEFLVEKEQLKGLTGD